MPGHPLHRTVWNPSDLGTKGHWAPPNASIDWCEANFTHTQYCAELFNTISNLAFVALAAFGIQHDIQERLPKRYVFCHLGLVGIGCGSAFFHTTLLYAFQLGDELPMIWVSSLFTWIVFDLSPMDAPVAIFLPLFLLVSNIAFIVYYILSPNPVFHQLCFGFFVTITTFQVRWLLHKYVRDTPERIIKNKQARTLQFWGACSFMAGFFLWNCDNLLCEHSDSLKRRVGAPLSVILEGHAWWHILTGLGVYLILVSMSFITLCIRDSPENYELKYRFGLPYVGRTKEGWQAIGMSGAVNERTALMEGS